MLIAFVSALALLSPDPGPQAAVDLSWLEGRWRACTKGRETVRGLEGENEPEMRWDFAPADGTAACG